MGGEKLLVLDTAYSDTFAPSFISNAVSKAGTVAVMAEDIKKEKYQHLDASHSFTPITVEMTGVFGPLTWAFLKDLGHYMYITLATGEERFHTYFVQRILVAIQRGNAASVMAQLDSQLI